MYIHKEGKATIMLTLLLGVAVIGAAYMWSSPFWLLFFIVLWFVFFVFILSFFRNPDRSLSELDEHKIYAPADGKVVVIEQTKETEYLQKECIQVSIFMSPLNVHVNRNPVSGKVAYEKYHKGKYLVAWHPKSSTENERHTTVYESKHGMVLMRQIAGALARRIVNYKKAGEAVKQGDTMGFIKFGSRVDLFLPLDANIVVNKDQVVRGNVDVIATF